MKTYEQRLNEALNKLEIQAKTNKAAKEALHNLLMAYENAWTCEDEEGTKEYDDFICSSINGFMYGDNLVNQPYYRDIYAVS
tara:strand:+ start:70 stop:315 length:246 start_codon:yes stop_codon:yes gene_type:complete